MKERGREVHPHLLRPVRSFGQSEEHLVGQTLKAIQRHGLGEFSVEKTGKKHHRRDRVITITFGDLSTRAAFDVLMTQGSYAHHSSKDVAAIIEQFADQIRVYRERVA